MRESSITEEFDHRKKGISRLVELTTVVTHPDAPTPENGAPVVTEQWLRIPGRASRANGWAHFRYSASIQEPSGAALSCIQSMVSEQTLQGSENSSKKRGQPY
jgi:hypothetical protein